jgi:hypothetical protein
MLLVAGDALALVERDSFNEIRCLAGCKLLAFTQGWMGAKLLYEVTSLFGSVVEFSLASCVR